MSWPPKDGTSYQPSNGTEGDYFMEGWCRRCKNDHGYEDGNGCAIIAASMAFSPGEPNYPKEWVFKDGDPICTAFDDEKLPITNEERAAQVPLFK